MAAESPASLTGSLERNTLCGGRDSAAGSPNGQGCAPGWPAEASTGPAWIGFNAGSRQSAAAAAAAETASPSGEHGSVGSGSRVGTDDTPIGGAQADSTASAAAASSQLPRVRARFNAETGKFSAPAPGDTAVPEGVATEATHHPAAADRRPCPPAAPGKPAVAADGEPRAAVAPPALPGTPSIRKRRPPPRARSPAPSALFTEGASAVAARLEEALWSHPPSYGWTPVPPPSVSAPAAPTPAAGSPGRTPTTPDRSVLRGASPPLAPSTPSAPPPRGVAPSSRRAGSRRRAGSGLPPALARWHRLASRVVSKVATANGSDHALAGPKQQAEQAALGARGASGAGRASNSHAHSTSAGRRARARAPASVGSRAHHKPSPDLPDSLRPDAGDAMSLDSDSARQQIRARDRMARAVARANPDARNGRPQPVSRGHAAARHTQRARAPVAAADGCEWSSPPHDDASAASRVRRRPDDALE